MSTILSVREVQKIYKTDSGNVAALRGVSCDFEEGKFHAIIGRSGSGKSTLLHVLSGLDRPTLGQVLMNGKDIYAMNDSQMAAFRRRHMGFVFQQFNLLNEYTVKKNICMPMLLDGKKPDMVFFNKIVTTLGLADKLAKYPSELSGGEQQRVAIARSLLAKPELIIADEPTGNLDKRTGDETMDLLIRCASQYGQTLIVVTHDPLVANRADIVLQIEDGKLK